MDSITNSINEWLLQFEGIREIAETIHTEELEDNIDTLALQRSGVEELEKKYVFKKGWYRQYQYVLYLKAFSEDDMQRGNNLAIVDCLSIWVDEQNVNKNFPEIEGMEVKEVSCANAMTYDTDDNGTTSVYYIQLYFNIEGGN